ncbi:UNVERIFIED_ORG: phosphoribosyl-AMP cyclohydrolase [Methylorubrum zatmanii]|nr:phosphoribosyl-AMP cyclohydrolase [Methylorubrum zatmanii]
MTEPFASPGTRAEVEEGARLTPRFGPDGLVACIAVDAGDGRVLMLAHMNAEALARTLETGEAWYWSALPR